MATLNQARKSAENLTESNLNNDLFDYIIALKKEFIKLNAGQIHDHKNSKGKKLENKNKKYSGFYTKATEEIAKAANPGPITSKKEGKPYNFVWGGDFMNNFYLYKKQGEIVMGSTGTGTGTISTLFGDDKEEFFRGYEDLFGLTDENLKGVIRDKILPLFIKNIRNTLNL